MCGEEEAQYGEEEAECGGGGGLVCGGGGGLVLGEQLIALHFL